jgi:hypothetical protein
MEPHEEKMLVSLSPRRVKRYNRFWVRGAWLEAVHPENFD